MLSTNRELRIIKSDLSPNLPGYSAGGKEVEEAEAIIGKDFKMGFLQIEGICFLLVCNCN